MRNITLLFFLMSFITLKAQVTGYVFTNVVGTYVPISATATRLASIEADEVLSAATNIGFNFMYEGRPYTSFKMSSNGFLSFGAGTESLSSNDLAAANTASRPIIAPLWDDLDGKSTEGSYAGYELTGTAPNRVLTVEWRNWEWNWISTAAVISFQVKLYETTNVIEFIYRPEAGAVNNGSASIGIGSFFGSSNGSYLNLSGVTTPTVTSTTSVTDINVKPVAGQIYRFTPPSCLGVIEMTATALSINSLTLNWTSSNIQRTGQYEVRLSGAPGSGNTGLISSGTTAVGENSKAITGLLPNTAYNFYLRLSCGADFSNWATINVTTPDVGQIGVGVATTNVLPLNSNMGYNYTQQIYLKAELIAAIGNNNLIKRIRFHHKSPAPTINYKDWRVFMGNTNKTTFASTSAWVPQTELNEVFNGEVTIPADGWIEIELSSPFIWDGVNNLVVAVNEYTPDWQNGAVFRRMDTTGNRGLYLNADPANPNIANPANGTLVGFVPQIIIGSEALPACLFPLNIRTSNLSSSSIKYTWNIFGTAPYVGVEYFLSTSADAPDSDSEPAGIVNSPTSELVLSELNENTRYYVWFRVKCSPTSTSEWTNFNTFKTNSIGQIGTGEVLTTSLPLQSNFSYNYSQQIYLASEVSSAIGTNRYVKKIKFHFTSATATANYKDWKVFIGNTTKASFAGTTAAEWVSTAGLTTTFNGAVTFPNPTGDWIEITLAEPFLWDGTSNIVVAVYENTPGSNAGANFRRMDTGTTNRGLLYRVDAVASNPNPNSPPAASERFTYVPQVVLIAEPAPACVGVASYSFSDVTINSVKLRWTNLLTSVVGTEYFIGTSLAQAPSPMATPTGTIAAPTREVDLTTLLSDTQYYVWFRNQCSATEKSAWSGVPLEFKTLVRGLIGTGVAVSGDLPMSSNWGYNYTQQIYLASEIRAALGGTGQQAITKLKFHMNTTSLTATYKDWKIFMGNTAKAAFTATAVDQWAPVNTMQQVFDGTVTFPTPTNDWFEITFTEPFIWDGTSNIVLGVNEYTPGFSNGASFRRMDTPGVNRGFGSRSDGTVQNPASPVTGTLYTHVPQIIMETAVVPGCLKPIYLGVANIGKNTASLNWTAPITVPANGYEYEVRTAGNAGSGAVGRFSTEILANTFLTKNLTGLAPSTEYSVYIRSKCSATSNSDWTLATKFTTLCDYPDFTVQNAALCGQGIVTLAVTVTGTQGVFRWYDVEVGGAVLSEGPSFTTPLLTANKSYWVVGVSGTGNNACLSERKKINVVVSAAPTFTLSTSALTICELETSTVVSLVSDISNFDTYTWSPSTGVVGNAQTGWVFNPTVTTEYVLTAKQANGDLCESVRNVKVTVKPLPVITAIPAAGDLIVCEGGIQSLEASYSGDFNTTIGTATTVSGNNDNNTAFNNRWSSGKSQLLFTAAELTAGGLIGGNINSLSFNIATPGSALTNGDYTVKIAATNLNAFPSATYIGTGFTTVYGPAVYTHTNSGWQEIVFTTPYVWDGVSNIIVEISHLGAGSNDNANTFFTQTSTNTLLFSFGTGAPTLSNRRYNVVLKGRGAYKVTWDSPTNIFTDEEATIPYVEGTSANKVYYKGQTEGYEDVVMTVSSGNGCPLVKHYNIRTVFITDAEAVDQEYCGAVPVSELVATGQEGAAFKWYRAAAGGAALAPTTLVSTGDYYVTQIIGTCESTTRALVHVTIKDKPTAPISPNRNICGGAMLSELVVTYNPANTLKWYDANQNLIVGDIALQTGVFYVSQSNTLCESDKTRVNISVNPVPATPVVNASQVFCGLSRVSNLAMQLTPGAQANWYDSMDSNTPLSPNELLRTGTYYGGQIAGGCESTRVTVTVAVYENVLPPVVQNQNFCTANVTVANLEASALPGATIKWYNTAVGGAELGQNQALAAGLYYVSQKVGECESVRVRVGVNIIVNTVAPNAVAQSFCGTAKVSDLHVTVATGMIVKWYSQEAGGSALANDVSLQSGVYYVSQSMYFCESPRRAVEIKLNPLPAAPTGNALQIFEEDQNSVLGNLVLDQQNIIWFSTAEDAKADTNRLSLNMPLIDGNVYFGVIRSTSGCMSLPFAVTVKINPRLGINDFDLTKLSYYPNPVKDVLTITYKETITRVEVYSLTGQRVLTMNASDNIVLVDMSRLATATYVVKIYSDNQSQFIKIIKN